MVGVVYWCFVVLFFVDFDVVVMYVVVVDFECGDVVVGVFVLFKVD